MLVGLVELGRQVGHRANQRARLRVIPLDLGAHPHVADLELQGVHASQQDVVGLYVPVRQGQPLQVMVCGQHRLYELCHLVALEVPVVLGPHLGLDQVLQRGQGPLHLDVPVLEHVQGIARVPGYVPAAELDYVGVRVVADLGQQLNLAFEGYLLPATRKSQLFDTLHPPTRVLHLVDHGVSPGDESRDLKVFK